MFIGTCSGSMAFQSPTISDSKREKKDLLNDLNRSQADTNRLRLFIQIADYYRPTSWDSTYVWLNKAVELSHSIKNDLWKNETLALLGTHYLVIGEKEKGSQCFMKIIKHFQILEDYTHEAKTWSRFAKAVFFEPNNIPDKITYFENAYRLFRKVNNKPEEVTTLTDIAECHLNQRQLDLAEKELINALRLYDSISYKKSHLTNQLLGQIQKLKGNINKQLYYYLAQVKNMESSGDTTNNAPFLIRLAVLYTDLGSYQNSRL